MTKIVVEKDDLQLSLLHPVYKTTITKNVAADGTIVPTAKEKLIKEIRVKRWFRKDGIVSVQEYITSKNAIATQRCVVYDRYSSQYYTVDHSVHHVRQSLIAQPSKNQIGYNVSKISSSEPHLRKHY